MAEALEESQDKNRLIRLQGRWKSESSRDMYIKDSIEKRLSLTKSLTQTQILAKIITVKKNFKKKKKFKIYNKRHQASASTQPTIYTLCIFNTSANWRSRKMFFLRTNVVRKKGKEITLLICNDKTRSCKENKKYHHTERFHLRNFAVFRIASVQGRRGPPGDREISRWAPRISSLMGPICPKNSSWWALKI